MLSRFKSPNATPPGGCYEYAVGDAVLTAKTASEITRQALNLRQSLGLRTVGDPFLYVMDYMCPRLPNGFCTTPSSVRSVRMEEVKARTSALFTLPCVTVDLIEARLAKCISCPAHETRGFCMSCTGLLDWICSGFGGRRRRLPPDVASGVCCVTREFSAALASVDFGDAAAPQGLPETCWRLTTKEE